MHIDYVIGVIVPNIDTWRHWVSEKASYVQPGKYDITNDKLSLRSIEYVKIYSIDDLHGRHFNAIIELDGAEAWNKDYHLIQKMLPVNFLR